MTYIDHIAPARATGPIAMPSGSAAKRWLTRLAGRRMLQAWETGTWLVG